MSLSDRVIRYVFTLPDGQTQTFSIDCDEGLGRLPNDSLPPWTRLECEQCPNCPLSCSTSPHCPLAVALVPLVESTLNFHSYEAMTLQVESPRRTFLINTTIQKAVSSVMGLLIATSGCPHTDYFRPMAHFHLPMADVEETAYRAAGMYLISRYLLAKDGEEVAFELDGLLDIYEEIHIINTFVSRRLRTCVTKDASVNAVVLLDMFSQVFPICLDDSLEKLNHLFRAYRKPKMD